MMNITLRWLGVAGIEIGCASRRIVIDPYVTRIPFHKLWFGKVMPDAALIRKWLPQCDTVLVSHAHVDHLLDVPEVVRQTGADAYGSPNTCKLLKACGSPIEKIHEINPGADIQSGLFSIRTFAQRPHVSVGGYGMQPLQDDLKPPLRARAYNMDFGMCYLVEVNDLRLLSEASQDLQEAGKVDVLFTIPFWGRLDEVHRHYQSILDACQPRMVIPIHCDDMWLPLDKPARGQLVPTSKVLPPLTRMDRGQFKRLIEAIRPTTHVFLPERMETYSLAEIL